MIQCTECEFFHRDEQGRVSFACDPFSTIKEPNCLLKWQLIKTNQMVDAYQTTLGYYHKLAPMQDRLFKAMERELGDMDESEKWKQADDSPDAPDDTDPAEPTDATGKW